MANQKPTDAELEILAVLWKRGSSTVREIFDYLGSSKSTGYTTTLKHVQIMLEKGFVSRKLAGRAHVYEAIPNQVKLQNSILIEVVEKAFGGSYRKLILQAVTQGKLSPEDAREIRKLLKPADKTTKSKKKVKKDKKAKSVVVVDKE
jgi:predicted transcriptional regulator